MAAAADVDRALVAARTGGRCGSGGRGFAAGAPGQQRQEEDREREGDGSHTGEWRSAHVATQKKTERRCMSSE